MVGKSSVAWSYFSVHSEGKSARCNYCHKVFVIANGSTGNLFRHMKLRHPSLSVKSENHVKFKPRDNKLPNKIHSVLKTPTKDEKSEEIIPCTVVEVLHADSTDMSVSENTSQQPVSYILIQPYDENKQQELNKQLLRIIIKNLIPFNIVEDQEFVKLVNLLNPNYILPSRKTLANEILVSTYESSASELKSVLNGLSAVALTVDRWTSINNEHFIAFSVHYLNKDLVMKSNFLQCFSSLQKFSIMDVFLYIEKLSSNWNLSDKILAVISDGCEEIKKAVHNCNLNHIPCFADILNKIVQAGLGEISSLVLKVRNVVQYFKKNSMSLSKFHKIQNEMGLSDSMLVKDIPSRWDTTFNMFTIFLKNRVPLLSTIKQLHLNFLKLTSADFNCLESAVKILVIFNSVKLAICSENYFSLSKIPHLTDFILKQLQNVLENSKLCPNIINMGNTMKIELKQFEELELKELVFQGVLLDPRFKKRGFKNDSYFKEACVALRQSVASVREQLIEEKKEPSSSSKLSSEQNKIDSEYCMDMWSEFESKDPAPLQSHTSAASVEVDAFLSDIYLSIENDPLSYWADISNRNKFPALFELAKRVLCIPATSVPHQQIYSKAGYIYLKKRQYLPSTKANKILFLHHNV